MRQTGRRPRRRLPSTAHRWIWRVSGSKRTRWKRAGLRRSCSWRFGFFSGVLRSSLRRIHMNPFQLKLRNKEPLHYTKLRQQKICMLRVDTRKTNVWSSLECLLQVPGQPNLSSYQLVFFCGFSEKQLAVRHKSHQNRPPTPISIHLLSQLTTTLRQVLARAPKNRVSMDSTRFFGGLHRHSNHLDRHAPTGMTLINPCSRS